MIHEGTDGFRWCAGGAAPTPDSCVRGGGGHARKLNAHPRLRSAWQAREELYGISTTRNRQDALDALGRFCDLCETGEMPEFHDSYGGQWGWV